MVDVRELQKRGLVPKNPDFEPENVETDGEGFANFSSEQTENTSDSFSSVPENATEDSAELERLAAA